MEKYNINIFIINYMKNKKKKNYLYIMQLIYNYKISKISFYYYNKRYPPNDYIFNL